MHRRSSLRREHSTQVEPEGRASVCSRVTEGWEKRFEREQPKENEDEDDANDDSGCGDHRYGLFVMG